MKGNEMEDRITAPSHYTNGELEAWDAILQLGCGYLDGNVLKYIIRFRYKGDPIGDLKKAKAYIDKLIEVTQASIEEQTKEQERLTEVADIPASSSVYWPYEVRTSGGKTNQED